MQKYLFILFLTFVGSGLYAQSETAANKAVWTKFTEFYNQGQFDKIFNMFSDATKGSLPLDKTSTFLGQLKTGYGNINGGEFLAYQGPFAIYKATFEKGIIALSLSVDHTGAITGLYAKPYEPDSGPVLSRNLTKMQLPFRGEWTIFWGGDTREQNYHVDVKFQKNAFDIVINDVQGKSHKSEGKSNEDYYAFGQELLASCDAEVVLAVDGVPDNKPGVLNKLYVPGNSVLLKTKNNEYIFYAHFKQNSIKVKRGDKVKQGQLLGLCGNSGNSSEPHLHFHIQNQEDINTATGAKCFFDKMLVNGTQKTDYSPIKGDKIKNAQ